MNKILTISIAAYNVENYIRKALDSLIDEEIIDDLEIFVVDDGGKDNTLKIAQEYAEKYPQSIFPVHKENGGYGSTINTSIELATGKYFKQLDGDDWYQTENIKKFISILKETSADCVLTYHYAYDEGNGNLTTINGFENVPEGEYEIEKSNIDERFSIKNATYKTELLKNMKERLTEHCFYTDAEFAAYPVAHVNTVCVCHLPIYVYRIGREGQSVSATGIKKHYKEQETVFWNVLNFYTEEMSEATAIKRNVVLYTLAMLYRDWYKFHCILPLSKGVFLEMREFYRKTKCVCPELVSLLLKSKAHSSKLIKVLLYSGCLAYPFVHIAICAKGK